jgi:hypothetical protein
VKSVQLLPATTSNPGLKTVASNCVSNLTCERAVVL